MSVFSTTAKRGLGPDTISRSCWALLRLWSRLHKQPSIIKYYLWFICAPVTPSETPQYTSEIKSVGGKAQKCTSASLCRHVPKFSGAVLTAVGDSGVCANRCCNPAQGKYWHKLRVLLNVCLLWTVVKPFPVAPASSGQQSHCVLGGLMGLDFVLPEVYTGTTLHLLSLTASNWAAPQAAQVSMSEVLTRSCRTLLGTPLVSQASTMPGCALKMGWCSSLCPFSSFS